MLSKEEMRRYNKEYYKKHYKSNCSVREAKNRKLFGTFLLMLAGLSKRDGGRYVKAKNSNIEYDEFEWSDLLIVNQQSLAGCFEVSTSTIKKLFTKAKEQLYIKQCEGYLCKNSKRASSTYLVHIDRIMTEFSDLRLDINKLANEFYNYLHDANETSKDSIKFNNKIMEEPLWQDVSAKIAKANESILQDEFKVKFLQLNKDGDYVGGRYFTSLCITKNPERNDNSTRIELIQKYFNTDKNIIEIDVNSMMLRTSRNLINDYMLPIDVDIYYELYKLMTKNVMNYDKFKGEARELIKKNVMAIYMDPRSVYCKTHVDVEKLPELNVMQFVNTKNTVKDVFDMEYEDFLNRLKEALYKFLSVYDFDMDKRVFFGKMFFKYEAIVYYYMHEEFKRLNIKVANVYDGFYFEEGTCDEKLFYKVYEYAIHKTKILLKKYNHDLIKLYGKEFTCKYTKYISYKVPVVEKKKYNVKISKKVVACYVIRDFLYIPEPKKNKPTIKLNLNIKPKPKIKLKLNIKRGG